MRLRVALTALLLWLPVAACSGSPAKVEANPVRRQLEDALAALDSNAPLPLRFNPAPCDCPVFELRLGERWLRADLEAGDGERLAAWIAWLGQTPPEALPVGVQVRGRPERELLRTAQGAYAARIEVAEIVEPLPPPEPTEVEPPNGEPGFPPPAEPGPSPP